MPLHVLTPAGGAEKEPQRHDAGIECRGCHPGIRHVQLVGAQVIRCGGVRRSLQKPGEILDGSDMSLLGFVAHPADAHVFDHPLAQRGGPLLRHGNLLSDG